VRTEVEGRSGKDLELARSARSWPDRRGEEAVVLTNALGDCHRLEPTLDCRESCRTLRLGQVAREIFGKGCLREADRLFRRGRYANNIVHLDAGHRKPGSFQEIANFRLARPAGNAGSRPGIVAQPGRNKSVGGRPYNDDARDQAAEPAWPRPAARRPRGAG
jgi:hypothetical protein